ncbi:hypothetical protein [Agromyces sp. ZXT2-6]|uniref:hypothetical protein n=1 Tax=Agromyces sp. ZXT2-6 TaxID=3461153 RepID=UPI004054CAF1
MPDHQDDLDERIARLQRIAYGADATAEARAAALEELASLRNSTDGTAHEHSDVAAEPPAVEERAAPTGDAAAGGAGSGTGTRDRRIGIRVAVVSAVAALLVGAATGWVLGSATDPSVGAGDDAPIEWTQAWQVFDRRAGDGDLVRHPPHDGAAEIDESSRRLLVTRSDGVRLVAARTADGGNACLILVLPVGRPGIACTEMSRFPAGGLRAEVSARAVGEYVAVWYADGRVTVNAAAVPSG